MSATKTSTRAHFARPVKVAGVLGGVGGFVGDVLTPLGPVVTYFAYCSAAVLVAALLAFLVVKGARREAMKAVAVTAGLSMVVFGAFGQISSKAQNGWLADHFDSFAQLQQNLNLLEARIDDITEEIHEVGSVQTARINEVRSQASALQSSVDSLLGLNAELVQALTADPEQVVEFELKNPRKLRRKADVEERKRQAEYDSMLQFFKRRFESWEAHRSNGADYLRACQRVAREFPHTELGYYCKASLAARDRNFPLLASSLDTCKQVFLEECSFCRGLLEDVEENTRALEHFPNSPVLLFKRAMAYQNRRNHTEALIDLKEVWAQTKDLEVLKAAVQQVWALKKWSEIEGLLAQVMPEDVQDALIESDRSGQFSNLNFLIPPSGGADLSYLNSDLVAEAGKVYVGHFLSMTSPAGVVEGADSAAFTAWFAAPARPVVDFEDCGLEVLPMHFARDRWAVQIAQLRQSLPGSLFTIVFRVREGAPLSGEVLAVEEGVQNLTELGATLNVHILETGRVTHWPY